MIKIYHNPRCTKSRQGLALLEEKNQEIEIIKYLDNIPTEAELKNIIKLLGIKPIALIRKNEALKGCVFFSLLFRHKYLNIFESDGEISY